MDRIPPYGALDDAEPYIDDNEALEVDGSIPPAKFFNDVQAEILAVIDAAGIARDGGDLTQLAQAIAVLYLPRDGSQPMAGPMRMDGNPVVGANTLQVTYGGGGAQAFYGQAPTGEDVFLFTDNAQGSFRGRAVAGAGFRLSTDGQRLEIHPGSPALEFAPATKTINVLAGWSTSGFGPFSREHVSPQYAITPGGALVYPHGLATTPKVIQVRLVCHVDNNGFVAGDELLVNNGMSDATNRGVTISPDPTNIYLRFGAEANTFTVLHKTSGGAVNLVNANWRIQVRCYA